MLDIDGLTADLGEFTLNNVDLRIREGEYFVLLGPTGAGKTILLEVIAGIYAADAGTITLDGRDITDAPPKDRPISMVYQDYMLFPHLTVEENIRFGRTEDASEDEMDRRVSDFAELLDIEDLLHRYPRTLSGGEKQRATLARSLVMDPELLLLDEPVSALDVPSKDEIIDELKTIHKETGVTIMHVTHGREEALRLGDRVGIVHEGDIVQTGTTAEVFERPRTEFVARFVGTENVFQGTAQARDGAARVQVGDVSFDVDADIEGPVTACLRPERLVVTDPDANANGQNQITGTVTDLSERVSTVRLGIDAGVEMTASMTKNEYTESNIALREEIGVQFAPSAVHLIPREDGADPA